MLWLLHVSGCAASAVGALTSRITELESVLKRQAERIADLERTTPKEFEIIHFNVLADQVGRNIVPWFCYGADVTAEERVELHKRFYGRTQRHPGNVYYDLCDCSEGGVVAQYSQEYATTQRLLKVSQH